ncbi:putative peptide transporter ptr2 [Mycena indigotica]|uniref:Putative peptide transporter ptr2 n=1 Tax=Mycena indigotica TaxID=2126181 RepID=A0A8H6S330_9AGAR|nr:putative peptide transporter ptr2 [Mycena indigotica]KAF7291146.1 putative peptide transporter ptr2 [Mycena indigotica]
MSNAFSGYTYQPLNATENEARLAFCIPLSMANSIHSDGIHDGLVCPTEEERLTLRRVADKIPWSAYQIAIVELAERFSFYGAGVVFTNFVQYPLPPGSSTGAGMRNGQSGALGQGQRFAAGVATMYQFWCYLTPFIGAYIADVHLGRFATVCIAVGIAFVGHVILVIAALPGVIGKTETSLFYFSMALAIMGLGEDLSVSLGLFNMFMNPGTGLFKANISPLVAEQYKRTKLFVVVTDRGEKVLVDPALTVSRIYLYFYLMINLGALVGQIGMTYSEKYVGFWLAFTLPTIVFLICPVILYAGRNRYSRTHRPTSSVLLTFIRLMRFAWRNSSFRHEEFWESAKPSRLPPQSRPHWMSFDDDWVEEVRRGVSACKVFLWFPVYWLTMSQMNSNLTSQAATMQTNGLPNDVLSNIDPLALLIFIPLSDHFFFPGLLRRGIRFTPLKRIISGFLIAAAAMVWAAVLQSNIYNAYQSLWFICCNLHGLCRSPAGITYQCVGPVSSIYPHRLLRNSRLRHRHRVRVHQSSRKYAVARYVAVHGHVRRQRATRRGILRCRYVRLAADPFLVWNYTVMAFLAGAGGISLWWWVSVRGLDREDVSDEGRMKDVDTES